MSREFKWVDGYECWILPVREDLSAEIVMRYDTEAEEYVYTWTVYENYVSTKGGKCLGLMEAFYASEAAIKKIVEGTSDE